MITILSMLAVCMAVEAPRATGATRTSDASVGQDAWRKLPGGAPPVAPVTRPVEPPVEADSPSPFDDSVDPMPVANPLAGSARVDRDAEDDGEGPVVWKLEPQGPRRSRSIRWRIDPFAEIGTLTVLDRGYAAFDDNRSLTQVGVGLRVDRRIGRSPVRLGGSVRYAHATSSADPFGLRTRLRLHGVLAAVRASVVLVEGVDILASIEAGPQFTRANVASDQGNASSRKVLGAIVPKAGIALYLPKQWLPPRGAARFTGGFEFNVGYAVHTMLRLRAEPDVADDAIDTRGVSLGDVRLHGVVWSFGLFARFM